MTSSAVPTMAPPITYSYVSDGPNRWKIPETGTVVLWDEGAGEYRMWNPSEGRSYRWVRTRDNTMRWEYYGKKHMIDFWACLIAGSVLLGICWSSGFPDAGLLLLGLLLISGTFFSWLHTKHPTAYDVASVGSLAWALWSMHDRYKHR